MEDAVDGSRIPSKESLTKLQTEAQDFRTSQISELYHLLTGTTPEGIRSRSSVQRSNKRYWIKT